MGHPIIGASWEGFVIESLLAAAPARTQASFYRTARGSEIDLVLDLGGKHGRWAIEIKSGLAAKTTKGFTIALEDIQPNKTFIVYGGEDRYPKGVNIEAINLRDLAIELKTL